MSTPTGTRAFHLSTGDAEAVHVYSNKKEIWLQLRRAVATQHDIGTPSFKVAVSLTVKQAVALAGELLSVSAGLLSEPSPSKPIPGSRLPFFPNPAPADDRKGRDEPGPKPVKQGKFWSAPEEEQLVALFDAGNTIPQIAVALERGTGGVQARLIKLGRMKPEQYAVFPAETLEKPRNDGDSPDAEGDP